MCLVALALDSHPRFPLVIAANRDEFYARPAAPMGWWSPSTGAPPILAGRDIEAGGTWLGLTAVGRFGFVTNVRGMTANAPAAPSRGRIVTDWLREDQPFTSFWPPVASAGHNGFNVVAADFSTGELHWASNCAPEPVRIGSGIHAVSNHLLDTPWPKLTALKSRLAVSLDRATSLDALTDSLFDALADPTEAHVDRLPSTGLAPDRERRVSPAFIRMPDAGYGTRCSTVIVTERIGADRLTHVLERSFDIVDGAASTVRFRLEDWPVIRC